MTKKVYVRVGPEFGTPIQYSDNPDGPWQPITQDIQERLRNGRLVGEQGESFFECDLVPAS